MNWFSKNNITKFNGDNSHFIPYFVHLRKCFISFYFNDYHFCSNFIDDWLKAWANKEINNGFVLFRRI